MVSPNLNRVLHAIESLNDAERQELRRLLDQRTTRESQSAPEVQLRQLLLDQGIISHISPRPTEDDVRRFEAWAPVPIAGKPLSQTIVEDRR